MVCYSYQHIITQYARKIAVIENRQQRKFDLLTPTK
jgi:hypothetical protein